MKHYTDIQRFIPAGLFLIIILLLVFETKLPVKAFSSDMNLSDASDSGAKESRKTGSVRATGVFEGNCAPVQPTHVGAVTDSEITALTLSRGIYVSGGYAYVASGDGFQILDISDPANPSHTGAISNDQIPILSYATGIYVSGDYAYVAALANDGIEILDVSDPANPTHVGAITDNEATALDGAENVFVSGNYAYVASFGDNGMEILDISDPANPAHAGAVTGGSLTALFRTRDVCVSGSYAYLASADSMAVVDVSDPASPAYVGAITDDETTALDGAASICISGNYAYVASEMDDGVEILDISDPANPVHVGAIFDSEITELDGAASIHVVGDYAYVASRYDNGVQILDISNPASPAHVGAVTDDETTALDHARGIYVSGDYAYVASYIDDGVEVLRIRDCVSPFINITGTPLDFGDIATGGVSEERSYTVEGANLTGNIVITSPGKEFMIRKSSDTQFGDTVILISSDGLVPPTAIEVRFNPRGIGPTEAVDITHTSEGAVTQTLSVRGNGIPNSRVHEVTVAPMGSGEVIIGNDTAIKDISFEGASGSGEVTVLYSYGEDNTDFRSLGIDENNIGHYRWVIVEDGTYDFTRAVICIDLDDVEVGILDLDSDITGTVAVYKRPYQESEELFSTVPVGNLSYDMETHVLSIEVSSFSEFVFAFDSEPARPVPEGSVVLLLCIGFVSIVGLYRYRQVHRH